MNAITDIWKRFEQMGEFYAAGFYEEPEKSLFIRFARAERRYLENYKLQPYNNEPLYPCGAINQGLLVGHDFSYTVYAHYPALYKKDAFAAEHIEKELSVYKSLVPREHAVGGNMYTHSYPNFRRIIGEGLDSYEERIQRIKDQDIRCGLLDILCGIRCLHNRILKMLKECAADSELYQAFQHVPFKPARTLYEAMVCWNFIYYLDGCDNIGSLDTDLIEYYNGEDYTDIFRCFFENVDATNGWSGTLGPNYNELTVQCLKAIKGLRRPSLELRVTENMPQEIWDKALESIYAGGGSPSLYNEKAYQQALKKTFPDIPEVDRLRFAGGGCTETMLTGISNVGSLDAGINIALIFEKFMRDFLPSADNFEEFYKSFMDECHTQIVNVLNAISASQKLRAKFRPNPMRTLLTDDCIDNEKDFNNGGARYYWSVVNIAGMINVLDSLLVIKQLVFSDSTMSGTEFLTCLDKGETFLKYHNVVRHGTDSDKANELATRLSEDICSVFEGKKPYLGGAYLPASIQFTTYADAGKNVGATPDGRTVGAPLCDSIGAIHGNDKYGVTSLLNSAASICQQKMSGTPVLNLKLESSAISKSLKALVMGYFDNGGMQMQVTCVSREELLDAKEHPEKYPNLIVRIGGYSEYFNRLSPELQQTVIDRTFYGSEDDN